MTFWAGKPLRGAVSVSERLPSLCVPRLAPRGFRGVYVAVSVSERLSPLLRVLMLDVDVIAFLGFAGPGPQLLVSHAYWHAGYRKRLC